MSRFRRLGRTNYAALLILVLGLLIMLATSASLSPASVLYDIGSTLFLGAVFLLIFTLLYGRSRQR